MTTLGLHNLSVSYGRRPALRAVTIDLDRPGRVVGFFGPNGAGKTTALRVLAGLINRYTGTRVVPGPNAVAFLPDAPFLYEWLRLTELTEAYARRWPDFRRGVAAEILGRLGLDPGLSLKECSRGMSEQIHIALTVARSPRVYALDEPLGSIDPATRRQVIELIQEHRAPHATLLISTHLIDSVASMFDDVAIIADGTMVLDETVSAATHGGSMSLEDAYLNAVGA